MVPTPAPAPGSLRGRLALLAAASIAPMLLLFAAEGYADYRAERTRAGQRQLEVTRSMAATVERELAGAVASLRALALSPRLQAGDLEGFRNLAVRFVATQPPGSALALLDRSGQHLLNTRVPPGGALPHRDRSALSLTESVFGTGQPQISSLFPRAIGGGKIVTADVPVFRDGQVAYDLSLVLPAERFSAILAAEHLLPGTAAAVFDRDGLGVARVPDPLHMAGRPAPPGLLPQLLSRREGLVSTVSVEGVPFLTAFSRTEPSGWSVGLGVPEASLRAPLRHSLGLLLGAGLVGLASSLGVATLLAQGVLGPMRALARFAADPSLPNASQLQTTGVFGLREVDAVAAALRHSFAERQAAIAALQALNEGLETRVRQEIAKREQALMLLAQAQRMEALGQLAGGIAHDFNNVLQAVTGGLGLILRRSEDAGAVRRLSRMAADAAGRGAAITGRLLTFARRGDLQAAPIRPLALLDGLREMLSATLASNIAIVVEAQAGLPSLLADRGQLETVLVNLSVNARDAMPDGGTLTLWAGTEQAGAVNDHQPDLAPGRYIRITVRDTGAGMDAATLERAAEPFFTTKVAGQGTGLGLSMARGFAEQSGGGLCIDGKPGEGTRVSLWFPQAGKVTAPPAIKAAPAQNPALPPMRLLLVDDDSMVREVVAHELEDRGFAVTTACDGTSALALLEGGQACDLMVTDYAMPGMNGLTLIREARLGRPHLPAFLLTGYAEPEAGLAVVQDRLTVLLRKPISGEDLAARAASLRRREAPVA